MTHVVVNLLPFLLDLLPFHSLKTHNSVSLNHVNLPSIFNIEDDIYLHKISVTENLLM